MSKRLKWFLAVLLALGSVVVVRAALEEIFYLPVVLSGYPIQPTPTPVPGIYLIDIDYQPTPNPMEEYVEIENINIDPLESMEGWTLRDENANVYTFPVFSLMANDTVKVWTKAGQNWPWDLYWGMSEPVWNDHGDCAYLRDKDNNLVDTFCYGSLAQSTQP
jgi:hypothetical protein